MDWKCNLKQTLESLVPLFAVAAAMLSASAAFRLFDRYLRRLILATALCAVIAALMQLAITYFSHTGSGGHRGAPHDPPSRAQGLSSSCRIFRKILSGPGVPTAC
jgi:hypothetical protein